MSIPYVEALDLVKQHHGTSGQAALAKCILSLYNREHAFSLGEVLAPLDDRYSSLILALIKVYIDQGETDELRQVGSYVYDNFPRLVELSNAMSEARAQVRTEWDRQHQEEMRKLYPEEYE